MKQKFDGFHPKLMSKSLLNYFLKFKDTSNTKFKVERTFFYNLTYFKSFLKIVHNNLVLLVLSLFVIFNILKLFDITIGV